MPAATLREEEELPRSIVRRVGSLPPEHAPFRLMATAPVIGVVTFLLLVGLLLVPRCPSALIALPVAIAVAKVFDA
jgi:hypothetical protein